MAPAVATLRLPTSPRIGRVSSRSQVSRTSRRKPSPSLPITKPSDILRSVLSSGGILGPTSSPTSQTSCVFSFAHGVDQVGDLCHVGMLDRAGGGVDHRWRHGYAAPLLNDDAMNADGVADADQRADVLRVFQQVEQQDEGFFAKAGGMSQDVFQIAIGIGTDPQRQPLVIAVVRQVVEDAPLHALDWHAQFFRHAGGIADRAALFPRVRGSSARPRLVGPRAWLQ